MASQLTAAEIRRLSIAQRDILVRHITGDQPVIKHAALHMPTTVLIQMKCLLAIDGGRKTTLTERGRYVAAFLLGQYADALVAAGCLEPEGLKVTPTEMLRRLKAERAAGKAQPDSPAELAVQMAGARSPARA